MRRHFELALITTIFLIGESAVAQGKNQLAVSFGRTSVSHQTVPGTSFVGNSVAFGDGPSIEANYSRLLKPGGLASFSVEFPLVLNLDEDLNYGVNIIPEGYYAFFVTPSARLAFFPRSPFTPWASIGGGFAHFSESSKLLFGGPNTGKAGNTTGAFQLGAGVDIKAWKEFSVRVEVRDFYSGVPQLNVNTGKTRQSNLFVGAGVVWQFGR